MIVKTVHVLATAHRNGTPRKTPKWCIHSIKVIDMPDMNHTNWESKFLKYIAEEAEFEGGEVFREHGTHKRTGAETELVQLEMPRDYGALYYKVI